MWYNEPTMLLVGSLEAEAVRPAMQWVHYTTSCNSKYSAPEDWRDHCLKHVELTGIINKPLLLHLVGVYIIYVNDAQSNKYQTLQKYLQDSNSIPHHYMH